MEEIRQKLIDIINLQNNLNINTSGKNWTSGITNKNRKIDWLRCIRMELAEFIDSFPWKHWKDINGKIDIDNAKIELVDILHFVLSYIIATNNSSEENIKRYTCIIKNLNEEFKFNELCIDSIIEKAEELQRATFDDKEAINIFEIFFELSYLFNLQFEELFNLYIGKNVLNEFRQNNGYKEGKYIKIWDNKEDNVVMQEILASLDNVSYINLYNELEDKYNLIKEQ